MFHFPVLLGPVAVLSLSQNLSRVAEQASSVLAGSSPFGPPCTRTEALRALPAGRYCYHQQNKTDCVDTYATKDAVTMFRCFWDSRQSACTSEESLACTGTSRQQSLTSFTLNWDHQEDSLWLGKDWFANGVQDWRVANGRVECISNVAMTSGRTAHLLTRRAPAGDSALAVQFTLDMVDKGSALSHKAFGGILVGMGHQDADYRQTALVQMVPGPGGGILVGVDADGKVGVHRFNETWGPNNFWHACHESGSGYNYGYLKQLAECPNAEPFTVDMYPLRFRISYAPGDILRVFVSGKQGAVSAKCTVPGVPRDEMQGKMSFFSAQGPQHSSNGFAFDDLQLTGFDAVPEHAFGPVLGVLYTQATYGSSNDGLHGQDGHQLRMTVQLPVMSPGQTMNLQLSIDGVESLTRGVFHAEDGSWTSRFVVSFDRPVFDKDRRYRILKDGIVVYSGTIRREKKPSERTIIASLSCPKNAYGKVKWNAEGLWFPFNNVTSRVKVHDPDLLFFSGDQVYNGDLTPADTRSEWHSVLDYHYKWQRFLWSFGHLTRDRPTVSTPDDHDMYQGNLWGEGGHSNVQKEKRMNATNPLDDIGGFWLSSKFVNAVLGTQVSNLPPSRVSQFIGNEGVRTYTTSFRYGGLDIAVIADRLWKAGGHEGAQLDLPLLGEEQERFLEDWAKSKPSDAWTKVVLSQTPFASLFTGFFTVPKYGEYPESGTPIASRDSNGYPPSGRLRAVRLLADAGALHLTGDQHLGVVAQYGTDDWGEGGVVFSSPAVACAYPRFWMPEAQGRNAWNGSERYMGDYEDGFSNKFTVLAVSNPVSGHPDRVGVPASLAEKSPGYGIIRFHPDAGGTVALENWPNWADPCDPDQMYADWPILLDRTARPLTKSRQVPEATYTRKQMLDCYVRWSREIAGSSKPSLGSQLLGIRLG